MRGIPVRARLCEPGEQGSIVTTYPDFRETEPYSWNVVGIDTETLLAPGSDPRPASQLMLYRVTYALREKGRMRESLPQFREYWLLLEQAGERLRVRMEVAEEKQTGDSPPSH